MKIVESRFQFSWVRPKVYIMILVVILLGHFNPSLVKCKYHKFARLLFSLFLGSNWLWTLAQWSIDVDLDCGTLYNGFGCKLRTYPNDGLRMHFRVGAAALGRLYNSRGSWF